MSDNIFENKLYQSTKKEIVDNVPDNNPNLPMEISRKRFVDVGGYSPYVPPTYNAFLRPILQDTARPRKFRKARTEDWRYSQNYYGIPKRYNEIELRDYGESWAVHRCKSIIINEVLSAKYKFTATSEKDYTQETSEKINMLNVFFKSVNRDGMSMKKLLRYYMNDMMDLGYGVIVKGFLKDVYVPFNPEDKNKLPSESDPFGNVDWRYISSDLPGGFMRELFVYDSSTFYAHPDKFGNIIGWWQRVHDGIGKFFSKREIASDVMYEASYDVYGVSPVGVVSKLVSSLLKTVANTEQYMANGAIPPGILALSKITAGDFTAFKKRWKETVEGNPSNIPLMSSGDGELKFIPLVVNTQDIKQMDLMVEYAKIVMSVFHVTPAELGITDAVNKSSADQQSAVQKRAAVFPFLDKLEDMINRFIVKEFDPEGAVRFEWIRPKTKEEELAEWNLIERQLNSGYHTINDIKTMEGEILKKYGHVPFNINTFATLVQQLDPSLMGFRQLDEDPERLKMNFMQRQTLYMLEQLQHGLNNDRDMTPIALRTLHRLRGMQEMMNQPGTLASLPSSIIESEAIMDSNVDYNVHGSTQDVFRELNRVAGKAFPFRHNEEALRFLTVINSVGTRLTEEQFQSNRDKTHDPLIEDMFSGLRMIFRQWYRRMRGLADSLLGRGFNIFDVDTIEASLRSGINRETFRNAVNESFYDAYKLGYATNNDGKPYKRLGVVEIEEIQPEARLWLDQTNLSFADKTMNDMSGEFKRIITDGIAQGLSMPNIKNKFKEIVPVEMMQGESKESFKKRKKSHDNKLMRIARTEVIKASNRGRIQQIKDLGATHWEYHTHFDERNKDETPQLIAGKEVTCRDLHGKIYRINDTRFLPPIHPNGRCSIHGVYETPKTVEDNYQKGAPATIFTNAKLRDKARDERIKGLQKKVNFTFRMIRNVDTTGISGVGQVGTGAVLQDGTTIFRWNSKTPSTNIYGSLADFLKTHVFSHPENKTEIEIANIETMKSGDIKSKITFHYGAGVLLCEEHKILFRNKTYQFETKEQYKCHARGCENRMPHEEKKMASKGVPIYWGELSYEEQKRRKTSAPFGSQIAQYPITKKPQNRKEGLRRKARQRGSKPPQKEMKPEEEEKVRKAKIKQALKKRMTSFLINRQIGKVFNEIDKIPGVALDLKGQNLTLNGTNIDVYELKDKSFGGASMILQQAKSAEGLLGNQITQQLGSLAEHGEIINAGLDFIASHNFKPITGGLKGKIADTITNIGLKLTKEKLGEVKLSEIGGLKQVFVNLDSDASKLFDVLGSYTINDTNQAIQDITNKDNWGVDEDGKFKVKSQMIDDLVSNIDIPPELKEKWDIIQLVQDKYVKILETQNDERKSRVEQLEELVNSVHDDFGEEIMVSRNKFFYKDKKKPEEWHEYTMQRLESAINTNEILREFVITNEEPLQEAAIIFDQLLSGKAMDGTSVDVLIPSYIDGNNKTMYHKFDVKYRPSENEEKRCGKCKYFQSKQNKCDIVLGAINENFVCDKWEALLP